MRWRTRETWGIRSVCWLLLRRRVWQQPPGTSFPSASPLLPPRRSTRNIPSPWRVAYTGAPLGPLYGTASETGTTASTWSSAGPFFPDVTSEDRGVDEDGLRM